MKETFQLLHIVTSQNFTACHNFSLAGDEKERIFFEAWIHIY